MSHLRALVDKCIYTELRMCMCIVCVDLFKNSTRENLFLNSLAFRNKKQNYQIYVCVWKFVYKYIYTLLYIYIRTCIGITMKTCSTFLSFCLGNTLYVLLSHGFCFELSFLYACIALDLNCVFFAFFFTQTSKAKAEAKDNKLRDTEASQACAGIKPFSKESKKKI